MGRIVRKGEEGDPYRLQESDLPADGSLSGSFLSHVDLSGFDLSAFEMRFVSTADCDATGVILPDGLDYLYSRRTDWTDARVPPLVSSLCHDLVVEVMRHHTAKPGTLYHDIIEGTIAYVSASYSHSWNDNTWRLVHVEGLTREQVRECFSKYAFAGYQRCLNRLESTLAGDLRPDLVSYATTELKVLDPTPVPKDMAQVYGRKTIAVPFEEITKAGDDIWQAARNVEAYLEQRSGVSGWRAAVFSTGPYVMADAKHQTQAPACADWWAKGLGR